MMTCVIIPGISATIIIKMIIQIWYNRPYENIFEEIIPVNFCTALIVLCGFITLNQMFGARAGNTEYYLTVNIYMLLQAALAILLVSQWTLLFNKYETYTSNMFQE